MDSKPQALAMTAACFFFLLLSLAGIAAVVVTDSVNGVDGLLLFMLGGGMALLFAWLTFSGLQAAGIVGGKKESPESSPAAAPSAAKAEGK